jgi:vancomycin permeability regulator SanA
MKKLLLKRSIICFVIFTLYGLFIVAYGHLCKKSKADVCVVLGNTVNKDGTLSYRLKARLDKSIGLYNKNFYCRIIVSGGLGKEGFKEAEIMRLYLLENGIGDKNIIVDNNGNNTFLTAKFTADYISKNNYSSVLAISQYYHLFRIQLAFKKLGVKNIRCASPKFYEIRDLLCVPREMVAIVKYLLFIK